MRMQVSAEKAGKILGSIRLKDFPDGLQKHWHTVDGQASASSFLWLFCWAKTGHGNEEARRASRAAFDEIFGLSLAFVEALLPDKYAERNRYNASLTDADLEVYLARLMTKARE
jgi:hypothetical protein